jgi:hypothetical protein
MWTGNTIIALILLALAVAGAWRWYEAQSKNQKMETAAQDVRETAECHLEAFKLRPGLTETDLEVQAAFMDIERFGDIVAHPVLGGLHYRYARI